MNGFYYLLLGLCLFNFSCNESENKKVDVGFSSAVAADGEQLFKANCYQCHRAVENFVAPPLAGAGKKWQDKETLYAFIRNSQEVIKSNKYAADLYRKWNNQYMQPFPDLTDKQIEAILAYCDAQLVK